MKKAQIEFNQQWGAFKNSFLSFVVGFGLALILTSLTRSCEPSYQASKTIKNTFRTNDATNTPIKKVADIKNETGQKLSNSKKKENIFLQKQIDSLLLENQKLIDAFASAPIAKKDSLYNKAIELNEYSKSFEDEFLKADIKGVARGTVETMTLNYEILPTPTRARNHLYIGFATGNSVQFDKPLFSASLGYQLKKGNIISIKYDSEKRVVLGYDVKFF